MKQMLTIGETLQDIPVFPLHSVLFPQGQMPLRIFEPRYIDLVRQCMQDDCGFVVAAIQNGDEVGAGASYYSIGTYVRIVDFDRLESGLLGITIKGQQRVEITDTKVREDHLHVAVIKPLPAEPQSLLPVEFTSLADLLQRILLGLDESYCEQQPKLDDAGWVANRLTELLPLSIEDKQALLEIPDALSRLMKLSDDLVGIDP